MFDVLQEIGRHLDDIEAACTSLRSSLEFKYLLQLVLELGNMANTKVWGSVW